MIGACRLRPAVLTALCAASLGAAAAPASLHADAPSPCRLSIRLSLSDKLVCPFVAVEARLQVQASCPLEDEGRARVTAVELDHELPAGIRLSGAPTALEQGTPAPRWRIDPFPVSGITLTHEFRAIMPGSYALDEGIGFRIEDDRGRTYSQSMVPLAGNGELTVAASCEGQRRSSVYLPLLQQPSCLPSRLPADIVLAIDRSTSLGRTGSQDAGRHARAFLDSVHLGRDRVALLGFDQRVELLAPLGSDRRALNAAIDRLEPGPGTEIDRAIEAGAALLAGSGDRRPILVLITDGVQTGPRGPAQVLRSAEAARADGLQILAAAVGRAPDLALLRAIGGDPRSTVVTASFDGLGQAYRALGEQVSCAR